MIDSEVENFLKNGGRVIQLPPSNIKPKAKKIRQFSSTEMLQVVNFVNINGVSSTRDIALYLDIPYPKLKCILSYAEEQKKLTSYIEDKIQYWTKQ
ncbi:hypothetical protein I2F27_11225 [Acinetobacter sp. B5B]|uniref:hypothetical protein n=1 Tax=Acinetobacter baretiae TaxID=2605383 RepID=UPI0018C245A5|nr:hypothetical protein [Acinetobacter baretiae]MBF7683890.1 hypothetical protein [Acinetobacter baretiae]